MADKYVWSGGSNTSPYDTWAKAATAPITAINAAAAGETVFVHAESFTITASETWVLGGTEGNPVKVICSNDTTNAPPLTLGTEFTVTHAAAHDLTINGRGYIYGLTWGPTGSVSTATFLQLGATDDDDVTLENFSADYTTGNTSAASDIIIGAGAENNSQVTLINPSITLANATGASFNLYSTLIISGGTISGPANYSAVFTLIGRSAELKVDGTDMSGLTGTTYLFDPSLNLVNVASRLNNVRLHASTAIVGAYTGVSQGEVYAYNTAVGDVHYAFFHSNCYGQTAAITSAYANDGALYDGTNHVTWQIDTTANASYLTPYCSPWIEKYHSGTSAITPYLEIVRNGSATAFDDDEVWAEFSIQANTGTVTPTFKNDRKDLLDATPNAQTTSSKTASDWTGENATAWFGKLEAPSATTPAEVGMLRARVYVGVNTSTAPLLVDPKIRT